jgi:transcriptional regulator with XRE-family HTH domain
MPQAYVPLTLAVLRRQRKLNQNELASLIGKQQSDISHYENGIKTPDQETLVKLAEVLGAQEPEQLLQPYTPS